MKSPREHFERIGKWLDEDEDELRTEDAKRTPGERIARSLSLSSAQFGFYRRLLAQPGVAEMEEERALRKADLHAIWRARHGATR
jgi:hypothetical protein